MRRDDDLGERLSESELWPEAVRGGQDAAYARDLEWLARQRDTFIDVDCPACAGGERGPAFEKDSFRFVTCRACGTIYLCPRPTPAILTRLHEQSENFRYWADVAFPASEAARRRKLHEPRVRRIIEICRSFAAPPGVLVEVGAGFGTFAQAARESGAFRRVIAIEPMQSLAEACRRRGLEVLEKPIESVAAGEIEPAGVVAAFEVIEHLFAPRDLVRSARTLLAPGGVLVLSCPSAEGFDIALLGPHSLAVGPHHMNLFTPQSLRGLVGACGLEVLETTTPGRLDAEFVRQAALDGRIDLHDQPFLRRVLIEEWERLGWPFQQFLAEQGLSSHLWLVAQRPRICR